MSGLRVAAKALMASEIPWRMRSPKHTRIIAFRGYRGSPPGSGEPSRTTQLFLTAGMDVQRVKMQKGRYRVSIPTKFTHPFLRDENRAYATSTRTWASSRMAQEAHRRNRMLKRYHCNSRYRFELRLTPMKLPP